MPTPTDAEVEAAELRKIKDPNAVLDYLQDWAQWLPEGDTIVDATWVSDDPVLDVVTSSHTTTTVTVWLSGGEVRETKFRVTCHVTTAGGRQDDRTFIITCKEK